MIIFLLFVLGLCIMVTDKVAAYNKSLLHSSQFSLERGSHCLLWLLI